MAGLRPRLEAEAHALGFEAVGLTTPDALPAEAGVHLREYLAAGHHGAMAWLADRPERRMDPRVMWPEVRTIIMLGMNYGPVEDPLARLLLRDHATISVYAQGADYHDVIKRKLKTLARWLAAETGQDVKVFVDTAAVMEKPLAAAAGLGWQGKHTNLVSRQHGSWLFLGAIYTAAELEADAPETDHCGRCTACLDICPTAAFPAPRQLDARRCLSYLTIEHKGPIPAEFRAPMGNRIYGCDDCLAVCPWNKWATAGREAALQPRDALQAPLLRDLAGLDDAAFRAMFAGTAVKRIGRDRFVRNVAIALGNTADPLVVPVLDHLLDDAAPLVRGMAVWALARLLAPADLAARAAVRLPGEADADVMAEWTAAIGPAAQPGA
jgi:epoxyqueuosine reductase